MENATAATYALRSPVEVVQFLDHFAQNAASRNAALDRAELQPIDESEEYNARVKNAV